MINKKYKSKIRKLKGRIRIYTNMFRVLENKDDYLKDRYSLPFHTSNVILSMLGPELIYYIYIWINKFPEIEKNPLWGTLEKRIYHAKRDSRKLILLNSAAQYVVKAALDDAQRNLKHYRDQQDLLDSGLKIFQ